MLEYLKEKKKLKGGLDEPLDTPVNAPNRNWEKNQPATG